MGRLKWICLILVMPFIFVWAMLSYLWCPETEDERHMREFRESI